MIKIRIQSGIVTALLLTLTPLVTSSHHAVSGFFDQNDSIEIEGVVTSLRWRNPHTDFVVEVTDESGGTQEWRVETGAVGVLQARGLYREFLRVGDHIKVLGNPSVRGLQEVFANNVLLGDGKEVLLTIWARAYFSIEQGGEMLEAIYDEEITEAARENADGIFRVWSTNLQGRADGFQLFDGDYPELPATAARRSEWNAGDVELLGCTEWSMPRLMSNPGPMEFVRQGNDILMRFWEDDNRRLVLMDADSGTTPAEHSLMGYSTGRWDGETLIVETTNLLAEVLDGAGTPQSTSIEIVESFTPSPDGSRLDYILEIADPEWFFEPFQLGRNWIWRPEIVINRYACEEEQPFASSTAN